MQPKLLKGSNASYFFFPEEESTIIARSNYSVVFIAAELNTKEKVICKQLLPAMFHNQTARLKFFLETSIALRHEGLANTIDLIIDDGRIYVIQEFVYGFSLKELIAKREYFDYRFNYFFYRIISKVLDTLAYIHAQQLCHCDIKPSNIMVCGSDEFGINMENPEIKIIDTGLLKPCFQPAIPDTGGKSFSIMYASPEQVLGFSELVGEHSDIFSTGLILYEAIAKEPALNTTNPMFIKKIQTGVKIEKHFRFDEDLYDVISKATVKPEMANLPKEFTSEDVKLAIIRSLGKRYQSVNDFKADVLRLIL